MAMGGRVCGPWPGRGGSNKDGRAVRQLRACRAHQRVVSLPTDDGATQQQLVDKPRASSPAPGAPSPAGPIFNRHFCLPVPPCKLPAFPRVLASACHSIPCGCFFRQHLDPRSCPSCSFPACSSPAPCPCPPPPLAQALARPGPAHTGTWACPPPPAQPSVPAQSKPPPLPAAAPKPAVAPAWALGSNTRPAAVGAAHELPLPPLLARPSAASALRSRRAVTSSKISASCTGHKRAPSGRSITCHLMQMAVSTACVRM